MCAPRPSGPRPARTSSSRPRSCCCRSPCLKGGAGRFRSMEPQGGTPACETRTRIALEDAARRHRSERWIQAIDDYHFPVVTLSDKTEPDALCTIFETLNRTGVKLSVFELLTARFWPQNINLRALWDKAHGRPSDHRGLRGRSLLRPAGHLARQPQGAFVQAQRRAEPGRRSTSQTGGTRSCMGSPLGLEILRDDCKVMLPKWLPYQTMLPPLAAVLARRAARRPQRPERSARSSSAGSGARSSARPTKARQQPSRPRTWSRSCAWLCRRRRPESVTGLRFDPKALRDVTPRQRAIYRGVICLILGQVRRARLPHPVP